MRTPNGAEGEPVSTGSAAFATVALDTAGTNAELRCAALVNRIHAEQALGRVDEAERLSTTLALALSR